LPTVVEDRRPPGPRDWKVDVSLNGLEVHVRPRNDLTWHPADDECTCGPTTWPRLDGDTRWLVVHHALDGREDVTVNPPTA
jgi:hypothetical protein